jgi:transposase
MPKSHRPYPLEYRRRMVEMVRAGKTPEELSRQFEPSAQAIGNWVRQFDRDEGRRSDGLTSDEREELNRLRRENRVLREEKEILKNGSGTRREPPARRETLVFVDCVNREERPSAFWCS